MQYRLRECLSLSLSCLARDLLVSEAPGGREAVISRGLLRNECLLLGRRTRSVSSAAWL